MKKPMEMAKAIPYEIQLGDALDEKWAAYFAPFQLSTIKEQAALTGLIHDQAELFGILLKIRDLGLKLVSVNPVERDKEMS